MTLVASTFTSTSPLVRVPSPDGMEVILPPVQEFDPFDQDQEEDVRVLTTERRLLRLAIIAADTAARFVREGIETDPVAWLLTPRALFDGERAIDACQGRMHFARAVVLHGLALGLDGDPDAIDALLADDDLDVEPGESGGGSLNNEEVDVAVGAAHLEPRRGQGRFSVEVRNAERAA